MTLQEQNRMQTIFDFMLATCDGNAKSVEGLIFSVKDSFKGSRIKDLREAAQCAAEAYAVLARECAEILEQQ